MANEHIFNNSITVTGSVSSSVGFYGDGSGLSGITAVAEWDGTRDGNASITGSLIVSGSGINVDFTNTTGVSGSFSGSFSGDGSGLTGLTVPGLKPLDDYIITIQNNHLTSVSGSSAPSSSLIITNLSGSSFVHTPTEFGLPNANELFLEDSTIWIGYNWVDNVYNSASIDSAYRIVRLEDVVVDFDNATLSYTVAENTYVSASGGYFRQGHGNDVSENYIFLGSRGVDGAGASTGFQLARIGKYDFSDIEIFQYPNDADTAVGDVLKYHNGYVYVQSQTGYSNLKVTKVNAFDLSDYNTFITGTSGLIGNPGVLEIYKNQIITTTGYLASGILLLKYTLDGKLVDSNTIVPPTGAKTYTYNVPHASIIKDNYLYITQVYSYTDVLKINADTLELVDSLAFSSTLNTQVTDDIAIGKDGYLYTPSELTTFFSLASQTPPKLYKVDTTDLSFTEATPIVSGSYGAYTIKNQTLRDQAKPFTYNFNGVYVGELQINGGITGSSFTGSYTGDGSGLTNLPLSSGLVSSSAQISYTGITDIPTNIVSSSAQFITLTSPFTGSFTGSFTGDGAGLTGVVGETSTQIFQTGSGIAGSIIPNSTLSFTNIASGQYSTVIGGNFSTASADYSTVLGGRANKASATYAVAGGQGSCATGVASVAIGSGNVADAAYSVVLGRDNQTSTADTDASILGGRNHVIGESETSAGSVIAGGYTNVINGYSSGILAGEDNTVSGPYSGIIGGCSNTVAHTGSVALGGCNITVDRDNATFTPHLYISGSGTDVAAGDYAGIAQLAIRTVNPTSPKAGMLMVSGSSSSPNLYFYTNSSWTQLN